jgi:quercetin dioxygenase-like cupin family protein
MIQVLTPDFTYSDERGKIVQLASSGYAQINVLMNKAGIMRGGHYHKIAVEAFYVVSGKMRVSLHNVSGAESFDFSEGDFFLIEPLTVHSMTFPEDCVLIALYDIPIENPDGYKDIWAE